MALSKLDMLIIRACKSNDPHKRLMSVRRHFWYRGTTRDMYNCFIPRLVNYCQAYSKTTPIRLLEMSRPRWFEEPTNYTWEEITYSNLISEVRLTQASNFPQEMIWPVCYRRDKV